MHLKTIALLEFDQIKRMLSDYAVSNLGKRMVDQMQPRPHLDGIRVMLRETTEAKLILDSSGSPPMNGLTDLTEPLQRVKAGGVLDTLSLQAVSDFLRGCRKLRDFMMRRLETAPMVAGYAQGIFVFPELEAEIERCIRDGTVTDDASSDLKKIRKEHRRIQDKIRSKLQQMLTAPSAKVWLQETVVSMRDSRQVLLVKAAYKHQVPGIVLGSSGSGSTLFIEPQAVHQLNNELRALESLEQEEIYQILAWLSGEVGAHLYELERNQETMAQYDLAFAKARLSRAMRGIAPALNDHGRIRLSQARHPLLTGEPVPLDLVIGTDYRTLVITGPNTGGKTVALKTIGLMILMTQAGLHIPAGPDSEVSVFQNVLADIGDGQNIAQSLSTFSAHITNIIEILKECNRQTLVLLDEVGTGTDPAEGAALAIAILEYLHEHGGITIASTHYPEIKHYALVTSGFKNGCMAFDRENLKPLYRLIVGKAGESNALWISAKLGMASEILQKAERQLAGASSSLNRRCELKEAELIEVSTQSPQESVDKIEPVLSHTRPSSTPATVSQPHIKVGDMVYIPFLNEQGRVCSGLDAKGNIRVIVKEKKLEVPVKRVKLKIAAEQLYPEGYDLNVAILNKEERRAKHQLERKHVPGLVRIVSPDEK